MSYRSRRVLFTGRAESDKADILVYGDLRWGEEQALAYDDLIDKAVARLAEYPEMGRSRDDLFVGCRSLPVEQHVIYYDTTESHVTIHRILHKKMHPEDRVTGP
jgi:toxin ParE1/3/4